MGRSVDLPEWVICAGCRTLAYGKRFRRDLLVCPECGLHERMSSEERISALLDEGSAEELDFSVDTGDPLGFVDSKPYTVRLREAQAATGMKEAVVCVRGTIDGNPVMAAVMDFCFLGGSLGAAVGELITRTAELALAERTPLLVVTSSGGARMQEGALSLMQMAKTSQALRELDEAGILTISLITDPTYGGVAASFATQADVIVAEPGARLGFAGPRVIQQTIRQSLPEGFQTAEFLVERGMIDMVVPRQALRVTLARLLSAGSRRPAAPRAADRGGTAEAALVRDSRDLPAREPWDAVRLARALDRPTALQYIQAITDDFVELRGDRLAGDCRAIIGGLARLDGAPLVIIGHQKGRTTKELADGNFGMPSPAGYRKAARLMRLAAKLGVPVVTLVDTPGAHPGVEAETEGQAVAIADTLRLMTGLPVPVVSVVTGEGGSGGALALAVANRVLAFSNAIYSVISPEGCAAILWRDSSAAPQAARALRLDARSLLELEVVDAVIPEPEGGAQGDHGATARNLKAAIAAGLDELSTLDAARLVENRRVRFRRFQALV
ncbi:acetyl-CoA carboxylase carboxyltransferase subunit alpha [Actinomadura rudentiformis]|uniref:Multifunctional fusion protein n=1 Tax=Actinomadura rudentiformis TaxID=359158 RepID=A0A6H9YWU4_9ACTN|nr:acetyl-CoA carboxylase carboxyltransferase subunit alpha [Actinomadura rudentiformis]KAB2344536.1 acetyl-CoA carboxylase carboxyltransferase subunit alpha [Actinomadura rudentiformis]